MAEIKDYLPGGSKFAGGNLDAEINDASSQQAARQDRDPATGQFTSTQQQTDWETRYKELEKLNSRQAQTVGEYRKIIDDFIVNPTPATPEAAKEPARPITVDDLYADPDKAVKKAVESHPAIQEALQVVKTNKENEFKKSFVDFEKKHPDFKTLTADPAFQNWVVENPTRADLYSRGNQYDLSAADALFSLYKAEKGLAQSTQQHRQQRQIAIAELESSSNFVPSAPAKYSRSEYITKLTLAKQGNREAEDWVRRNSAGYRVALSNGNVRD